MVLLKHLPVDDSRKAVQEYCVGDTDTSKPYHDYVPGTPVTAALYGIEKLALQYWKSKPDLLISGPNEGNNMGVFNNNSGTLGAAMMAIAKGVPAMAVSAHMKSAHDHTQAPLVAQKVLDLIAQLEASRKEGQALLPKFTGLNVNLPEALKPGTPYKFTRVGWSGGYEVFYSEDLGADQVMVNWIAGDLVSRGKAKDLAQARKLVAERFKGANGLSMRMGNLGDTSPLSEGNVMGEGVISVSVIDANVQASAEKTAAVRQRLGGIQ